ncbi:MAG: AI-2E family transporter [Firmicutes bacterium]|nr:AI-2E family transporter [Bacillota bacterium]
MKKQFEEFFSHRVSNYVLGACAVVLFYLVMSHLTVVLGVIKKVLFYLRPLIFAAIIAYLLNPIAKLISRTCFKWMKKRRLAYNISVGVTVLLVLALIMLAIVTLVPQVISSATSLLGTLEGNISRMESMVLNLLDVYLGDMELDTAALEESWRDAFDFIGNLLTLSLSSIINISVSIGSLATSVLIQLIIAIYIMLDKDSLLNGVRRFGKAFLSPAHYATCSRTLHFSDNVFITYFISNIIDSLIVGGAVLVLSLLFRLPFPLLIALVMTVTNLIPAFGHFIGGIPCALIICLYSPMQALIFVIIVICIHLIDGNLIKPLLFGSTLGLPAVLVLVSVVVGGRIAGLVGMLLGIPAMTVIYTLFSEYIEKRLEKKAALTAPAQPEQPEQPEQPQPAQSAE